MADALAALISEQTCTVLEAPPAAVLAAPAAAALPWAAAPLAGDVAAVFDPLEHAVADAATRTRLAAANTTGTRMASPGDFGQETCDRH